MLGINADLGAKMSRELRRYGPNLLVTPRGDGGTARTAALRPGRLDAAAVAAAAGAALSSPVCPMLIMTGAWRPAPVSGHSSIPQDARPGDQPGRPDSGVESAGPAAGPLAAGAAATLVGAELEALHRLNPSWRVDGAWPAQAGASSCMIGASLAARAGVGKGDTVLVRVPVLGPGGQPAPDGGADGASASRLAAGGPGPSGPGREAARGPAVPAPAERPPFRELRLTVAGILATGEAEDEQLFLPLPLLREASGAADGALSLIALSVDGGAAAVAGAAARIGAATGADARPLHAIAAAQGAVLGKLQRMMVLLTLVVLTLSGLCLVTTLMASVVERQNEIGLMRSIGASDGQIARMFLGETGLLALAGGLAGIAVGAAGARLAGARLLGAAIEFRPGIVPVVLVISLALGFVSVLVPLRRALAIQPAAALRGE